MDKSLESYVKVYENWLDAEECKKAVKLLSKCNWKQHTFYNASDDSLSTKSGKYELDVSSDEISNHQYFMKRFWDVLEQYILKDLNFSWSNGWNGYSSIRYNMYKKTRRMAEHCDHIHSLFPGNPKGIPILSIVGVLNNDYSGGEFIMWENKVIPLTAGSVIVFPSNFLFPHRVEPVAKGIRYSCVSWSW